MRKIDKNIATPIYLQINEMIREMITDGELKEGDTLMSERDMSEHFDVSRMTINKAILKLADEGYVVRENKRTTIAKKRPVTRYENINGLTEMTRKEGKSVSNQLISYEEIKLPKWLQQELHCQSETGYKVVRIRSVDGLPLMLETAYLSAAMYPQLFSQFDGAGSMYDLFEKQYGLQVAYAEQVIRPVYLKEEQARLLQQKNGDLALFIKRHTYSQEEQVMEYTESIFLSQKHDLQIALH